MNYSPSQESDSKAPFTRKSLEPITEESIASSADLATQAKVLPIQGESSLSYRSVEGPKTSKPCPFTQGECPTKLAMMDRLSTQTSNSTYSDWSSTYDGSKRSFSSLLEKPFIFRRASSLNEAITQQETKLTELYLNSLAVESQAEETSSRLLLRHTSSTTVIEGVSDTVDTKSQTDFSESRPSSTSTRKALNYLMGLSSEAEEKEHEGEEEGSQRGPVDIDKVYIDDKEGVSGETEAMKQAQRYLRVHRIFEFFQFLVAHLISAAPENPINFLLDLLDKCIIYRAGLGSPPLLYDRKHLTALFNLMDRMRTGYIEKEQYVTGMKTLGICSFNPDPPTVEGMVHKDLFVEEAYENLVSMLNDILRRRWIYFSTQPQPMKTPPPTPQFSARSGKTNGSGKRFQSDKQLY